MTRWGIRSIRSLDVDKMRLNVSNLGCLRGYSRGVIGGRWHDGLSRQGMASVWACGLEQMFWDIGATLRDST